MPSCGVLCCRADCSEDQASTRTIRRDNTLWRVSMKCSLVLALIMTVLALPHSEASAADVHRTDFIADAERSDFNGFEHMSGQLFPPFIYTEDGVAVEQINSDSPYIFALTLFFAGFEGNNAWWPANGD